MSVPRSVAAHRQAVVELLTTARAAKGNLRLPLLEALGR